MIWLFVALVSALSALYLWIFFRYRKPLPRRVCRSCGNDWPAWIVPCRYCGPIYKRHDACDRCWIPLGTPDIGVPRHVTGPLRGAPWRALEAPRGARGH